NHRPGPKFVACKIFEAPGNLLEQRVARLRPCAVVDSRELIDLDQDHAGIGIVAGVQRRKMANAGAIGVDRAIHRAPISGFACQALPFCITIGAMTVQSPADAPLTDGHGRRISYLRLSVTDRCDLRCRYCMAEHMSFLPRSAVLSIEEMEALAERFVARGIRRIRLTGGEPLVRRGIDMLAG